MTKEDAIKMLESKMDGNTDTSYEWAETVRRAIKALEIVEEFEKAQIITGGRLNGRTYAYKCGLEDGKRKALEQQSDDCVSRQATLDAIIKELCIKDESYLLPSEKAIYNVVKNMPPVTPTHGTCNDCKKYRNSLKHCTQWVMPTDDDFYCADFEKRGNENDV